MKRSGEWWLISKYVGVYMQKDAGESTNTGLIANVERQQASAH
jgi:hypothetical protein